ncbi:MAG TPA: prepilin peptidase [Rhizomicrobium sp.]|nr:prepilin peptidase [Rhizomicrobium sp.]
MIAEFVIFVMLPALLIAAAGWDLASYTIPNFLQAALIAAFFLFAFTSGMTTTQFSQHLIAGGLGLAIGFTVFAFGYVGGGDAKLFMSVALWFGLGDMADFALAASLFGGVLTLALLSFRKLPLPAQLTSQGWILRLHDEKAGIPYGAALAAGAFAVLPYTDVFRLAVTR